MSILRMKRLTKSARARGINPVKTGPLAAPMVTADEAAQLLAEVRARALATAPPETMARLAGAARKANVQRWCQYARESLTPVAVASPELAARSFAL